MLTPSRRLPFGFEANGVETHFTNGFDTIPRSRSVFHFPKPETLAQLVRDAANDPEHPTWRAKVRAMPELVAATARPQGLPLLTGDQIYANAPGLRLWGT